MQMLIPPHGLDDWITRRQNGRTAADTLIFDYQSFHPPVNVIAIAQAMRVDVRIFNENTRYTSDGYLYIKNQKAHIITSPELSNAQQRFVIAHLLAHLLLHTPLEMREEKQLREVPRYWNDLDNWRDPARREEAEANAYAMQLLIPAFMIQSIKRETPVEKLMHVFQVSRQVMVIRLRELYGLGRH